MNGHTCEGNDGTAALSAAAKPFDFIIAADGQASAARQALLAGEEAGSPEYAGAQEVSLVTCR